MGGEGMKAVERIAEIMKKYVEEILPKEPPKGMSEFEYYYSGLAQAIVDQLDPDEVVEIKKIDICGVGYQNSLVWRE